MSDLLSHWLLKQVIYLRTRTHARTHAHTHTHTHTVFIQYHSPEVQGHGVSATFTSCLPPLAIDWHGWGTPTASTCQHTYQLQSYIQSCKQHVPKVGPLYRTKSHCPSDNDDKTANVHSTRSIVWLHNSLLSLSASSWCRKVLQPCQISHCSEYSLQFWTHLPPLRVDGREQYAHSNVKDMLLQWAA